MNTSQNQRKSYSSLPKNLQFSDPLVSLAIEPLPIDRLLDATSDYLSGFRSQFELVAAEIPVLTRETLPLHRTKETQRIIYVSAIALKLQTILPQPPMKIAQGILDAIDLPPDFTIDLLPPGWIQFHLSESGLATWLQSLNQVSIQTTPTELHSSTQIRQHYSAEELFPIEYAYARCCSLLRLGDREKSIALSEPNCSGESDLQIISPNPIPWLNPQNQLRLVNLSERILISRLVTTIDTLSGLAIETNPTQAMKLGASLSQDLLTFYRDRRIWGEISTKNLALAQARLGLIRATQIVLKLLLEKGLRVLAVPEI